MAPFYLCDCVSLYPAIPYCLFCDYSTIYKYTNNMHMHIDLSYMYTNIISTYFLETKIISDFLIVSKKLQSDGKAIVKMKLNIIPTDTELVLRITVNGSNRTQNFDFNIIKHEMAQSITLTINSKRMSTTLPQQVSSMKLFI